MSLLRLTLSSLAVVTTPVAAVTIDGRIEAEEWREAQHITDFRQTQPLTGAPGSLPTEAWVLATPDGLAVAFRAIQPPEVVRTRQRVQRDFETQVDRVNVMVDFNGDARTSYNFTLSSTNGVFDAVITNESNFRKDWDGVWQHATQEDAEGWSAEILIPWHTATMHKVDGPQRRIGLYLDRVVGSTGERMAWPDASFMRARFTSDFAHIDVPVYRQSLLAVTPYASVLHDNRSGKAQFNAGGDVFWKPSGQFQLTAALNPDFGQVESDDLVVNFDAIETWFSDKRPFFTENQGLFDFGLMDRSSALIYTRRVGGAADDGQGVADIDAALKLNGSIGTTNYGLFAADEADDAGRRFTAARLTHDFEQLSLGVLLTDVDRPWLDRRARVLGVDQRWQPNAHWTLGLNLVGSEVQQADHSDRGYAATAQIQYDSGGAWRQEVTARHLDDRFEINDFGYLERNDLDALSWEIGRRFTDLGEDSIYTSHDWELELEAEDTTDGLRLTRSVSLERQSSLRNGASQSLGLSFNSAIWDDRLTRGHGAVHLPPTLHLEAAHQQPRHGNWAWMVSSEFFGEGIGGNERLAYSLMVTPTFFWSDTLNLEAGLGWSHQPDWLLWQRDDLIGRYRSQSLQLNAGFNWSIGSRQELRMKLQAIGLRARAESAWRLGERGRPLPDDTPIDDFSVRNLGLQLRYRYQLAPLSDLYVVYGRGGYEQNEEIMDSTDLLVRSLHLRQDDQFMVKLSYRFD
jgi:hypothetical protein